MKLATRDMAILRAIMRDAEFKPEEHPRAPAGSSQGGEFTAGAWSGTVNNASDVYTMFYEKLPLHTFGGLSNAAIRFFMGRMSFDEKGAPVDDAALRFLVDPEGRTFWSEPYSTTHNNMAQSLGYTTREDKAKCKGGLLENKTLQTLGADTDLNEYVKKLAFPGEIQSPEKTREDMVAHPRENEARVNAALYGEPEKKEDYKGQHESPDHETGAPLWNVQGNEIYPKDFYDLAHQYVSEDDERSLGVVQTMRNKPNGFITVYRAVPKDVKKINPGDWVTVTRSYAKEHIEANLNGEGKILKKIVRPRDLFTEGNSLNEWGYDPQPAVARSDYMTPEQITTRQERMHAAAEKIRAKEEETIKPSTAKMLLDKVNKDGGFTYQIKTGEEPKEGFAVAPSKTTEKVIEGDATDKDIADYVNAHKDELAKPDHFLGAWKDVDDKIYLDVSQVFKDEHEAQKTARKADQIAYFNFKTGKSINTPSKGEIERLQSARDMGFDTSKVWYHGSRRVDRLTETGKLDPKRATSGPMPFFTNDPEVASNYANNKADTSLEAPEDYAGWFKVKVKGFRKPIDVDRAWFFLPPDVKRTISERMSDINADVDYEITYKKGQGFPAGNQKAWDEYYLPREGKGNPLRTAVEVWLNSGKLFGHEEDFSKVLELAGLKGVDTNFPNAQRQGVFPAYMQTANPLDTGDKDTLKGMLPELEKIANRSRRRPKEGSDPWAKLFTTPRMFVDALKDDIEHGTTFAWTAIPDEITEYLKRKGYDAVHDKGGKHNGEKHEVMIPFAPHQVKSIYAKFKAGGDPMKFMDAAFKISTTDRAFLRGLL